MSKKRSKIDGANDNHASPYADLESHISNAALRTNEVAAFAAPVRVAFHHVRQRLADIDGLSGKAVLDGIVKNGILPTDSAQSVAEVSHTQSKGRSEETIIVIKEISE